MAKTGVRKLNSVAACGDTVVIELTRGKSALVDACDYPLVAGHRWVATPSRNAWYAKATVRGLDGRRRSLQMHRVLLGLGSGDNRLVDHVDGNGLNNQRVNLRIATVSQNAMNSRKHASATSKFKGVSLHESGLWKASICVDGRVIYLGYFDDEDAAARAYNDAAIANHGNFACLNQVD